MEVLAAIVFIQQFAAKAALPRARSEAESTNGKFLLQ
jgi:hypothetical protein